MYFKPPKMKSKCPGCGSKAIHTQAFDQMCLDCEWDNSLLLVNRGQLDNPFRASLRQFDREKIEPRRDRFRHRPLKAFSQTLKEIESSFEPKIS